MRTQKNGGIAFDCACGGSFRGNGNFGRIGGSGSGLDQVFVALKVFQSVHAGPECHEVDAKTASKARRKQTQEQERGR